MNKKAHKDESNMLINTTLFGSCDVRAAKMVAAINTTQ
jgi:hypothetical protein